MKSPPTGALDQLASRLHLFWVGCLSVNAMPADVYDFHVPLAEVIDEAKAQCLKWAWTEGKEWPNTLAARLEEEARAMLDAAAELRAVRRSA